MSSAAAFLPAAWAAALDPVTLAFVVVGAAVGYALFYRRYGRPFSGAYRDASASFADRVARTARAAMEGAAFTGAVRLTDADLAALEAFYTCWLNLPRSDREAAREMLRREGIDMIRLGDTLRRLLPEEG